MAAIEELSPAAGPVSTRPPEDEIDDDEDEDVSSWLFRGTCRNENENEKKEITQVAISRFWFVLFLAKHG